MPTYGGAAARVSVPSLGDAREYVAGLAGSSSALGQEAMASPTVRRIGMHLAGFGMVALGGALTGWLASQGTTRGAIIGTVSHIGLYALTGALFGRARLTGTERGLYTVVGLGGVGLVGYLFYRRKR